MTPMKRKWVLIWWQSLPLVTLLAIMLLAMPMRQLPSLHQAAAPLPLLAIAYWTFARPQHLRFRELIGLGLFYDVFSGLPLGITPLVWCAFRYAITRVRKDIQEEGFVMSWLVVLGATLAAVLMQWLLLCLWREQLLPLGAVLPGWCVASLFYPLMHAVLTASEKSFHRRYWYMVKN